MQTEVEKYLKVDRQWPRHLRIAYAKYKFDRARLGNAEAGYEKVWGVDFWQAVLDANGTLVESDNRKYWK